MRYMNTTTTPDAESTARKRMALEPHGQEILRHYHAGWSMQRIVDWLAESPRDVHVARSSVFRWVKVRLEKLKARAAESGVSVDTLLQQMYGTTTAPAPLPPAAAAAQAATSTKTQAPKAQASTAPKQQADDKPAPWAKGRKRVSLDDMAPSEDADNPFGKK